ncbi:MAG: hypothetical protein RMJ43_13335 [Chloroherpetonaceae bacterium]|nr:hypothetical protein [Chloroherpetonaceae bacterium]
MGQESKAFRPTREMYARFLQRTTRQAQSLLTRYVIDNLTADAMIGLFRKLLERAHARAAAYGRQLAGDGRALNESDRALARVIMLGQDDHLRAFLADLQRGRYTDANGIPKVRAIRARIDLYIDRLRGTTNQTFVAASYPHYFHWRLGEAEHCEDCPRLAAEGPYRADRLPAFPGDGSTRCLTQCHCYLERDDGLIGFRNTEAMSNAG